ncbi:cytidylyltransferase domain-containing protein [Thermodesulfobacteriota bacterium]
MTKDLRFLGVIPARGGSKGIPRKNMIPIASRPLLWWSIQACKTSKLMDRFVVSTEDREIGQYAMSCGAEVLWRPKELAQDDSTTLAVLRHIIKEIQTDAVVLLQPTSPIRINGLVDRAIDRYLSSNADTVATGHMCRFWEWGTRRNLPRQRVSGYFYDDGNVYVMNSAHLKEGLWVGEKKVPLIVESFYHIEIDDEFEAWMTEDLLLRFINKYGEKVSNMDVFDW